MKCPSDLLIRPEHNELLPSQVTFWKLVVSKTVFKKKTEIIIEYHTVT